MSITKQSPRKIHLSGNVVKVNDVVAGGAITPGHLVERYNASGTPKFRAHATASGMAAKAVALDASMLNAGYDTAYATGDLVEVGVFAPGAVAWMLLASGENVVAGDFLESKGDGTMRKYTSGVRLFQVVEGVDNSVGPTTSRVKAESL